MEAALRCAGLCGGCGGLRGKRAGVKEEDAATQSCQEAIFDAGPILDEVRGRHRVYYGRSMYTEHYYYTEQCVLFCTTHPGEKIQSCRDRANGQGRAHSWSVGVRRVRSWVGRARCTRLPHSLWAQTCPFGPHYPAASLWAKSCHWSSAANRPGLFKRRWPSFLPVSCSALPLRYLGRQVYDGELWRVVEGCGGLWRAVEGCGGLWRAVEGCGGFTSWTHSHSLPIPCSESKEHRFIRLTTPITHASSTRSILGKDRRHSTKKFSCPSKSFLQTTVHRDKDSVGLWNCYHRVPDRQGGGGEVAAM